MRIVTIPRETLSVTNNDSRAAPTTTDGAAISVKMTASVAARPRKRCRASAMASGVPSSTEMNVEANATSSECTSALVRSAMSNTWPYQVVVNPFQWKLSRPDGAPLKL
jgi:hypothetical protein